MEPLGFAIGVIGLYSTCRDCYLFFCDLKNADKKVRFKITELDIEASALHAWGYHWGIHPPSGSNTSKRLENYLEQNPYKRDGVAKTLFMIGNVMSDEESLLDQYGIKLRMKPGNDWDRSAGNTLQQLNDESLSVQDIKVGRSVFKQRMRFLQKCKWTLSNQNSFSDLLDALRRYNSLLYHFCPESALEGVNRFRMLSYLDSHENCIGLRISSQRADELSKREEGPSMQKGLELLRDMAEIKAKAGFFNTKDIADGERQKLLNYSRKSLLLQSGKGTPTLAELRTGDSRSIVYVEFKSYMDEHGVKTQDKQDAVLKLGRLMLDPEAPKLLSSMECIGLFKDGKRGRIGFIFQVPGATPRKAPPSSRSKVAWDSRRPECLLDTIRAPRVRPLSLTWRFELARKLLENVIRLHACGWLHKNIRSESVLFFPDSADSPGKRWIDYSRPYLMGYDFTKADATVQYAKVGKRVKFDDEREAKLSATTDARAIRVGDDDRPDVYHHPDKRTNPKQAYVYAYDMYSFGLLLVEIGLWKPLPDLLGRQSQRGPKGARDYILNTIHQQVIASCGYIYAGVVETFVTMKPKAGRQSIKAQRDLSAKMASELARCVV